LSIMTLFAYISLIEEEFFIDNVRNKMKCFRLSAA